jgi:hypothetical protein
MVDMADESKYPDVKSEIDALVSNQNIKQCIIFILLNKKDLITDRYINESELLLKINISNRTIQEYNIKRHMVSILTGEGLENAFCKLFESMNEQVSKLS